MLHSFVRIPVARHEDLSHLVLGPAIEHAQRLKVRTGTEFRNSLPQCIRLIDKTRQDKTRKKWSIWYYAVQFSSDKTGAANGATQKETATQTSLPTSWLRAHTQTHLRSVTDQAADRTPGGVAEEEQQDEPWPSSSCLGMRYTVQSAASCLIFFHGWYSGSE